MGTSKRGPAKVQSGTPKEDEAVLQVDKWDSSAVRNMLDDAARKVLTEDLGVTEDYTNVDRRLILSCSGCAAAMFALVWDYLFPYPQSHYILFACVALYFILMTVLSFFYMYVQKNNFFFGSSQDPDKKTNHRWRLMSDLGRFSPDYTLAMAFSSGHTGLEVVQKLEKSIALYFDATGMFNVAAFSDDVRKLRDDVVRANRKKQE